VSKLNDFSPVVDVIAGLMHKPRTVAELVEFSGLHQDTVLSVLHNLREAGIARRAGSVPKEALSDGTRRRGKRPVLWAMQDKPHALPDAVTRHGSPLNNATREVA